jgi:hypothetical protein
MKQFRRAIAILLVGAFTVTSMSGCYGGFILTKKLYHWNGGLGSKVVNSIVMWAFFIIPVYEVAGAIDFLFLNTLEFWTGKNPVAMGPGEKEIQVAEIGGQKFELTASMNRMDIKALTGKGAGTTTTLVYQPAEKAWFMQTNEGLKKIVQFTPDKEHLIEFINPNLAVK